MSFVQVPLSAVADINRFSLPETTSDDEEIEYADLSSVNLEMGTVSPESMRFSDAPTRARRVVRAGDSLIPYLTGKNWAATQPLLVDEALEHIIFSTGFYSVSPRAGVDPRFVNYALGSLSVLSDLEKASQGVTMVGYPESALARTRIPHLPLARQVQVADFLDRETQRIDDALALLGGLEGLLAERFAGKIEDMLAPKPGSQRMRIDWVCDVLREQVSLEEIQQLDEVVLYSVDGVAATGSPVRTRGSEIESAKLRVHGGELLVSRLNPRRGHVTTTSTHDQVSLCSGEWVVLRPRSGFALEYLYFLFSSDSTRQRLDSLVRSVTKSHGRVDPSEVTKMWVTIPSAEVQLEISETLSRADSQRTEVSSLLERQRQLLAERRLALVSAAVTDQLDVEAVA